MENRDKDSGWRRDKLGVMAPVGSGAGWKEFFKVSRSSGTEAANMAARGRLGNGWLYFMLATSIATYKENGHYIIDPEHNIFMANIIGGSIGREGKGRDEALMGMTNIIAPAALSGVIAQGRDAKVTRLDRHKKPVDEDTE